MHTISITQHGEHVYINFCNANTGISTPKEVRVADDEYRSMVLLTNDNHKLMSVLDGYGGWNKIAIVNEDFGCTLGAIMGELQTGGWDGLMAQLRVQR